MPNDNNHTRFGVGKEGYRKKHHIVVEAGDRKKIKLKKINFCVEGKLASEMKNK